MMRAHNNFVFFGAICLNSLIILSLLQIGRLVAQEPQCKNPEITADSTAFAPASEITVNIDPAFEETERTCLTAAFENWNNSNSANFSGVQFTVTSSSTPVVTTDTSGQVVSGGTNVYQVNHSAVGVPSSAVAGTGGQASGGHRINAYTNIHPNVTNCQALTQTMAHEIGHTLGLGDCTQCNAAHQSVMIGVACAQWDANHEHCLVPDYNDTTTGLNGPTDCDNHSVHESAYPCTNHNVLTCEGLGGTWDESACMCIAESPGECPDNCPNPQQYYPATCFGGVDYCQWPDTGCEPGLQENGRCCCSWNTPIVVDVLGNGFSLTDLRHGVRFDLSGKGTPYQVSWTSRHSDDAWLTLDRNHNGVVDNGIELFGDVSPQPKPPNGRAKNGFYALGEFDKPQNGGNADGQITQSDTVFSSLRLWQDSNHNGFSEPSELHSLNEFGVALLEYDFKLSKKTDEHGNYFRYRAKIKDVRGKQVGRWAWDVVLQAERQ